MQDKINHSHLSPLRYPGGKGVLSNFIKLIIADNSLFDGNYAEVYAGGAGVALALLFEEYVDKIHINDISVPLVSFWQSVINETDVLCDMIQEAPMNMEEWRKQKTIQQNQSDFSTLEIGFSTFFLNRTNRSGILKGGVIGGKEQLGEWKMDARFNKKDLIRRIEKIARYRDRIEIYNLDAKKFIKLISKKFSSKSLIYLDPPYYNKGQDLYENHYQHDDHVEIAKLVQLKLKIPWIVSYDATPEILKIYKDSSSLRYSISYSAQDRYSGSEVIFFDQNLKIPQVDSPARVKAPSLVNYLFRDQSSVGQLHIPI